MADRYDIPIKDFECRFNKEYGFLYDAFDRVAGFNEAVSSFDKLIKNNASFKAFVAEFAQHRGDMITSDREAAAFMYVLTDMVSDKYDDGSLTPI